MLRSTLITGVSGSGKSQGILSDLIGLILARQQAGLPPFMVLCEDPQGQLGADLIIQLWKHGMLHRVLYDRLGSFEKVLPLGRFEKSKKDGWEGHRENMMTVHAMMRVIFAASQQDDEGSLVAQPNKYRFTKLALMLVLCQREPVSLAFLPFCFQPQTDEFKYLLRNCTDGKTRRAWERVEKMKNAPAQLEREVGGAERLVETVMDLVEYLARMDGDIDHRALIRQGAIVILDGSNCAPDAITAIFRTWQAALKTALEENFAETGQPLDCLIIADEAAATRSLGKPELDFMRLLRKAGGFIWACSQDLLYQSPVFARQLIAVTPVHIWYRPADGESARVGADDVGLPTLDEYSVHRIETAFRPTGRKKAKRISVTKGSNGKSTTSSDNVEIEYDHVELPHFRGLDDQLTMKGYQLSNLQVGERFIKKPGYTSPKAEYCAMLPCPFEGHPALKRAKVEEFIAISQQRPEFNTPQFNQSAPVESDASWAQTTFASPGNGIDGSSNFLNFIPLPTTNSSPGGSSPRGRKRGNGR